MDNIFLIKLILTFTIGATWVTVATMIAEKKGSKLGGVISGLPMPLAIALFFIGLTQTPQFAASSTTIVPLVGGMNGIYIILYMYLLRFNFFVALGLSFLVWALTMVLIILLKPHNVGLILIAGVALWVLCYYIAEHFFNIPSQGHKKIAYNPSQLAFRALLSGSIIASAVIMAKIGGPIFGGIFAVFPAIMSATMIITYLTHGKNFSKAVMKSLMVSGVINGIIYSVAVRLTYPQLGIIAGTVVSLGISLIATIFIYQFVSRKTK